MELDESLLEDLYLWIDSLPLSRPKKRIERDFSDGKEQRDDRRTTSVDFIRSKVFLLVSSRNDRLAWAMRDGDGPRLSLFVTFSSSEPV